jgi:hypothetical protein
MGRMHADEWVEVRSKEEILATLDSRGRLNGMPFMPQMFQYCGKRFRVYKRAHKTCDTIAKNWDSPGRRVPGGVHLNLRCDGKAYGGCQAACLIFWNEKWLKPVDGPRARTSTASVAKALEGLSAGARCTEADVANGTRALGLKPNDEIVYECQATQLFDFTKPLPWWDVRQYLEDFTSGNASLWRIVRGTIYVCYYYGSLAYNRKFGGPTRWLYDRFQRLWGGLPFPRHRGSLPDGQPAPVAMLNLQPGELVRVKPYEEILRTIDKNNKNRGMGFDGEMVPFCGGTYRVRSRVERFIDEKTGKLKTLKTPAVVLDNVFCMARYSNHRMYCPRSIYSWWREVWLERVHEGPQPMTNAAATADKTTTTENLAEANS